MQRLSRFTALMAMVLIAGVVEGKECLGISFAEQVPLEGSGALKLNGLGLRQATILKVNVYVGALYVAHPSNNASAILGVNAPYELKLQFVRSVGAADIRNGWEEGFQKNAKTALPALKERIATFNSWMSDVKVGEQLIFTFAPDTGLKANVGGVEKGTIKGDDFANAFLSIWLGDPPNQEIKTGLLGGSCE